MASSSKQPLSAILPPLICGTATFNTQFNSDPFSMPCNAIIADALALNINAFDTSPYYGPSESLLGNALKASGAERSSYFILTKVGRIAGSEFDYSAQWVRQSINRSLERFNTSYLDVVYCHDIEFVSPTEVLEAVTELRRLRDEGKVRYVGISGYPVPLLCELSEMILKESGEALDAVQSYANLTLQNMTLETVGLERFRKAGVNVITNASVLGMGLLRGVGVPGDWHPAPKELREKTAEVVKYVESKGEKIEPLAIRWALERWARRGGVNGGLGVSVTGVSNLAELDETHRIWQSVLTGLPNGEEAKTAQIVEGIWEIFGKWKDYAWESPDKDYVNTRKAIRK